MNKYQTIVAESQTIFEQYNTRLTLRQLYYRLVAKQIIANTLNNYKALSRIMVKAREKGDIDEWYIEDRIRRTIGGDSGYDDSEGFIEAHERIFKKCWEYFSLKMWTTQPQRLELWIEKLALSRIASGTADEYNVRTCPSQGYSSYTYIRDAVRRIEDFDKPVKILYMGDFDPSGLDIERDLLERLQRYGAANVTVERVALTQDQIVKYNLPPAPAKKSDSRLANFYYQTGSDDTVELDALEPPVLEELIRNSILDNLDIDAWEDRKEEIEGEKQKLKEKMEKVKITYE